MSGVTHMATRDVGCLQRGELFECSHYNSLEGFPELEGRYCVCVEDVNETIPAEASECLGDSVIDTLEESPCFLLASRGMEIKGSKIQLVELSWNTPTIHKVGLKKFLTDLGVTLEEFRQDVQKHESQEPPWDVMFRKEKGKWVEVTTR